MRYLSIKNFERYQHYKDRRPPWIKLHVSVLDDYDFIKLPDTAKAHLMLLWVLASQTENRIPHDLAWITQRIGARSPVDLEELVLLGFLEPYDETKARGKREDWPSRYVAAQTRADLLSAAQHSCVACNATKNLEIDHIKPISKGGTGDPSNLQVLCRQCNRRKRAKVAAGQPYDSAHLRSDLLRTQKNQRSPETETETEKRKKLPPKSPDLGLSPFPVDLCGRLHAHASSLGHILPYPRFRKALLPAYPRSGPLHTEPELLSALEAWLEARAAMSPKEAGYQTIERFAQDLGRWVRLGSMPRVDDNGVTERGRLAAGVA